MDKLAASFLPTRFRWWVWLCLIILAAFLAFQPGLAGPMLLDDFHNLAPLAAYDNGERTAASVIFGNTSGALGRSLAMASFVANFAIFGNSIYALKAVNLGLHLLTGMLATLLLRRLLWRDARLAAHADKLALLLGAIWLLHPLQVSTVLYIVQRMALLAALFTFAALLAYVVGRERIESGRNGGILLLFFAFPLLLLLAVLSKENGVLAPLLAAVLEFTLFVPASGIRRPAPVNIWLASFFVFPVSIGTVLLAWKHGRFLNYSGRDFDLYQRLLSESRILWDYVGAWLVPFGPRMGLYHDNFRISAGLLSPPSTLVALLSWAAVASAAYMLRRRVPLFTAGVGFYLCGHLLESTIFPLELYFEHRNYLPGAGILLAVAGLIGWATSYLHQPTPAFRRIGTWLLFALPLAYAGATWARSSIWGNESLLWAQEQRYNPTSPRVHAELATRAIEAHDLPTALHQIDLLEPYVSSRDRIQPQMMRLLAYCSASQPAPLHVYDRMRTYSHDRISLYGQLAWQEIATRTEAGKCRSLDASRLIDIGRTWLAGTPGAWQSRFYLALLLASQNRFIEAEAEARRAWVDGGHDPHIGIFLYQINGTLGNPQARREILAELEQHAGKGDFYVDRAIEQFRRAE